MQPNSVGFSYPQQSKNLQLLLQQKIPSEVAKLLGIPQQDFNKIPKQLTDFPFPNRVYFSSNGSSSPDSPTLTNLKTYILHPQQQSWIHFP